MKKLLIALLGVSLFSSSLFALKINLNPELRMGYSHIDTNSLVTDGNANSSALMIGGSLNIPLRFKRNKSLSLGVGFNSYFPTVSAEDSTADVAVESLNDVQIRLMMDIEKNVRLYTGGSYAYHTVKNNTLNRYYGYNGSGVSIGIEIAIDKHTAVDMSYTTYNMTNVDESSDTIETNVATISYLFKF